MGTPGAYCLVKPLEGLHVPATVQAVLAARIDRLAVEEKYSCRPPQSLAQKCPSSATGHCRAVRGALHHGLAHLQAADFLYETRLFPEREYTSSTP